MTEQSIWAIVPAAGVGRRMGVAMPKQYLPIHGRCVLDWTLRCLIDCAVFAGIYVAVSADDAWWPTCEYANHPLVTKTTGGAERADSVRLSLRQLRAVAQAQDWVLVHDAARPCVRPTDVRKLIDAVCSQHCDGGLLGVPVMDTLKYVDAALHVERTIDRAQIWRALTPQMFQVDALRHALQRAHDAGWPVTDEASAMEQTGVRPMMVAGAADNIKITQAEDLRFAEQVLRHD